MYYHYKKTRFERDRMGWRGTYKEGKWPKIFNFSTFSRVNSLSSYPIETNRDFLERCVLDASNDVGWGSVGALYPREAGNKCDVQTLHLALLTRPSNVFLHYIHQISTEDALKLYL